MDTNSVVKASGGVGCGGSIGGKEGHCNTSNNEENLKKINKKNLRRDFKWFYFANCFQP